MVNVAYFVERMVQKLYIICSNTKYASVQNLVINREVHKVNKSYINTFAIISSQFVFFTIMGI